MTTYRETQLAILVRDRLELARWHVQERRRCETEGDVWSARFHEGMASAYDTTARALAAIIDLPLVHEGHSPGCKP